MHLERDTALDDCFTGKHELEVRLQLIIDAIHQLLNEEANFQWHDVKISPRIEALVADHQSIFDRLVPRFDWQAERYETHKCVYLESPKPGKTHNGDKIFHQNGPVVIAAAIDGVTPADPAIRELHADAYSATVVNTALSVLSHQINSSRNYSVPSPMDFLLRLGRLIEETIKNEPYSKNFPDTVLRATAQIFVGSMSDDQGAFLLRIGDGLAAYRQHDGELITSIPNSRTNQIQLSSALDILTGASRGVFQDQTITHMLQSSFVSKAGPIGIISIGTGQDAFLEATGIKTHFKEVVVPLPSTIENIFLATDGCADHIDLLPNLLLCQEHRWGRLPHNRELNRTFLGMNRQLAIEGPLRTERQLGIADDDAAGLYLEIFRHQNDRNRYENPIDQIWRESHRCFCQLLEERKILTPVKNHLNALLLKIREELRGASFDPEMVEKIWLALYQERILPLILYSRQKKTD